jgi:transcriptional regulator with XRE-family HTH domain
MRHLKYDIRLAATIKALREIRRIKQAVVATALSTDQTTYCRIEQGEIAITPGQLKIISKTLGTSMFQILAIIETEDLINLKYETLSEILLKFVQMFEGIKTTEQITEDELLYIIEKIKSHFNS